MEDISLIRLQYEILNRSAKELASENGISVAILQDEIDNAGWAQLWPDPPKVKVESTDPAEVFATEADTFIDLGRKRLQVYSVAKELLLAQRYLALECKIIDAADELLGSIKGDGLGAQGLKYLSGLYKDLTSGSNLSNLASLAIKQDENGLPTVVIRDLSGQR